MVRRCLIAVTAIATSATAFAQQGPAPPPPPSPTGSTYGPMSPDMGPQDHANNPNSLERIREAVQKDQVDRAAAAARSKLGRSRPAKADEVVAGKPVNDSAGNLMGLIEKVEPDGAIVYNGAAAIRVPIEAFGVNRKGLLLDLTKDDFDKMVASANPAKKS